jgi:tight adherence protein B
MSRRGTRALVMSGLSILGLVLPRSTSGAQEPAKPLEIASIDTTAFPKVQAIVTVPNEATAVPLTPESFRVVEGQTPQQLTIERIPTTDLSVVLVIDTSASMRGQPMAEARAAATSFVRAMPAATPVAVVGFGNATKIYSAFGATRPATEAAIGTLRAAGNTTLYDAVLRAASLFSSRPKTSTSRSVMVVLTDGGDTRSVAKLSDVTSVLSTSGIESDLASLTLLAKSAGGQVVSASDPLALQGVFRGIADTVLNQYRLNWTSTGNGPTELTVDLRAAAGLYRALKSIDYPLLAVSPTAPPPSVAPPVAAKIAPAVGSGRTWLVVGLATAFLSLLCAAAVLLWPRAPRRRLAREFGSERPQEFTSFTKRAVGAAERFLNGRNRRQRLQSLLERAGMRTDPAVAAVTVVVVASIALLVGLALSSFLFAFMFAVLSVSVLYLAVRRKADKRSRLFQDQLENTLQIMTNSLKAGYGISQAIDTVAKESESPTSEEFRRVVRETRLGMDQIAALESCADRVHCEDLLWVTDAISVNRDVGGNLSELFASLSETLRARHRLARQVRALSAEGRLSANILMTLPFVIGGWMTLTNRPYIGELTHGGNRLFLVAGAVLMTAGFFWTRKIIRIRY